MLLFRIAFAIRNGPKPLIILALPFGIFYRLAIEWTLGIELPWKTQVGRGLRLEHGLALVVNDKTTFGCFEMAPTAVPLKSGTMSTLARTA